MSRMGNECADTIAVNLSEYAILTVGRNDIFALQCTQLLVSFFEVVVIYCPHLVLIYLLLWTDNLFF